MVDTPVQVTPVPVAAPAPVEAVQAPVVAAPAPTALATPPPATVLGEALAKPAEASVAQPTPAPAPAAQPALVVAQAVQENKGGQSAEPAPLPVYDAFKLPDGLQFDDGRIKEFTGVLSKFEVDGKIDHKLVQEFGQKAVDFHVQELKAIEQAQVQAWDKQKTDWKESFMKDPEIGGPNAQATIDTALNFLRTHGGTPEQQAEFRNLMEISGLGNHPAMIRLLANAGRVMREGQPLAAAKPVPVVKSRIETMYGRTTA